MQCLCANALKNKYLFGAIYFGNRQHYFRYQITRYMYWASGVFLSVICYVCGEVGKDGVIHLDWS